MPVFEYVPRRRHWRIVKQDQTCLALFLLLRRNAGAVTFAMAHAHFWSQSAAKQTRRVAAAGNTTRRAEEHGGNHHPHTLIVVTIRWQISIANRRAHVLIIVVPRTAPHHATLPRPPD